MNELEQRKLFAKLDRIHTEIGRRAELEYLAEYIKSQHEQDIKAFEGMLKIEDYHKPYCSISVHEDDNEDCTCGLDDMVELRTKLDQYKNENI